MIDDGDAQLAPRYAVLPLAMQDRQSRYAIFDRHTARIIDGVYFVRALALNVAAHYNTCDLGPPEDMTPNADALGLLIPSPAHIARFRHRRTPA